MLDLGARPALRPDIRVQAADRWHCANGWSADRRPQTCGGRRPHHTTTTGERPVTRQGLSSGRCNTWSVVQAASSLCRRSAGVSQPSVLLGRLLSSAATASRSSRLWTDRSVRRTTVNRYGRQAASGPPPDRTACRVRATAPRPGPRQFADHGSTYVRKKEPPYGAAGATPPPGHRKLTP